MNVSFPWAVGLVLSLAACGGVGAPEASGSTDPSASSASSASSSGPRPAPAADKGPECDGGKDAEGVHLLRGGVTALPDGGMSAYAEAAADGRHRTAVLSADEGRRTVAAGQRVTLNGHSYTVARICTYRVVLTTPDLSGTNQGAHMATWPTTQDGHWRLRRHVPDNGPALGAVVTDVQDGPARASISVTAPGQGQLAFYDDVRKGATVEVAGRLWNVESIDAGRMNVDMDSPDFRAGHVDLRELADP
ncbi:hypothetical protein ACFV0T_08195 [Streptomyces sp. NPDC059582]|uniref:hypothetical protein n=1 Tax=Streptomyces sp. NPDC059582 TaxID=3346875 RepID=UPI003692FEF5